jgi:hypothetical protein
VPENLGLLPQHQLARGALGEAPQQGCRLWQMLPETPRERAQGEHLHPPHHPWEPWVVAVGGCLYPQGRAAKQGTRQHHLSLVQVHSPQGWARGACLVHGVGAEGHRVPAVARGAVPPQ